MRGHYVQILFEPLREGPNPPRSTIKKTSTDGPRSDHHLDKMVARSRLIGYPNFLRRVLPSANRDPAMSKNFLPKSVNYCNGTRTTAVVIGD